MSKAITLILIVALLLSSTLSCDARSITTIPKAATSAPTTITVVTKSENKDDVDESCEGLSHEYMGSSLRRSPRGCAEQAQFSEPCSIMEVPIEVNVHAWKVRLDCLPTMIHISCRGLSHLPGNPGLNVVFFSEDLRSWCLLIPSAEKKEGGQFTCEMDCTTPAVVRREFTPPSEEGVRVQNINVSQNVRRCLLPCFSATAGSANRFPLTVEPRIQTVAAVDVRNTSDRNHIPISRVFDRFRNMRATSDQAEYMTQTASCSRRLAVVDSGNHGSV
ncbi:hypothetical protein Tco_1019452 [Tanacetum coccineum]|uniref:Uncharacterized protein n=1 Tax=Tanacetum coccineum TaxID=301880 RepID=A0ABQ5FZJ0_9ASTR